MVSVLITGCSRGIGLELVKQLANNSAAPALIIATCRNPENATALQELAATFKNIQILQLDVDDIASYPRVVEEVEGLVGEKGLNVLINNAAIITSMLETIEDVDSEEITRILHTNTVAPVMLTKALMPLVRKASEVNSDKPLGWHRAAIVNVSSRLGSVSLNVPDHNYGYIASKAALNRATRSLASEMRGLGVVVLPLHPGWVRTDLGGPSADIGVEESVAGLVKVLLGLDEGCHDKFLQWDGQELSW